MADGCRTPEAFDLSQIAAALNVAKRSVERRASKENWTFSTRTGRGGEKRYYPLSGLPTEVQAAILVRTAPAAQVALTKKAGKVQGADQIASAWKRWEAATELLQARANRMAAALDAVARLVAQGQPLMVARQDVAAALQRDNVPGSSVASLSRWAAATAGAPRSDWAALLLPGYAGSNNVAECDPQCWDWYKGHYLTRAKPTHADTYQRTKDMATAQGWALPSARTMERRLNAEVSRVTQIVLREGPEAAARVLPTQPRDALAFAVGEAVNGDGLKFDRLWVKFEDGEVINTATAWVWQDIHSRKLLAWRLAKTENTDVFRLATYDLTGVTAPSHVWMDNTRVAANKLMTAGAKGRHRFKSDPEDGVGLLLMLGMEPHFTNPDKQSGNPGAKPIERAFGVGGLHEMVATNPRIIAAKGFSKATAIDVQLLREVIAEEVARFNAKTMRRTQACRNVLSFDQAWEAGLQQRPPRVLADAQRRLLLMAREVIRADHNNGELRIEAGRGPWGKNAYWCEHLPQYAGRKVAAHYDPDNLHAGVHVYSLDGRYLFAADHIPRAAFGDTTSGREWSKFRRRNAKANKEIADNAVRMDALEREALYQASKKDQKPEPPTAAADSTVVRGHFQRTPDPQRDALKRTGTDDHRRETSLSSFLEAQQARQLKESGWEPPEIDP